MQEDDGEPESPINLLTLTVGQQEQEDSEKIRARHEWLLRKTDDDDPKLQEKPDDPTLSCPAIM
jgi:hypothetical protein